MEQFHQSEKLRVEKLFSKKHKLGFLNKLIFSKWYLCQLLKQNYSCHYCDTSIFDINKLINSNLLAKRATGYGFRGPVLEIDRKINCNGYNEINCVLSCYYCNNDKSYILDDDLYKQFFGSSRRKFFLHLLKELD